MYFNSGGNKNNFNNNQTQNERPKTDEQRMVLDKEADSMPEGLDESNFVANSSIVAD